LKTYGEAPDTVSVSIVAVAEDPLKPAEDPAGRLSLTYGKRYVNEVVLIIFCTFVEIL
jgi:hypothetical protein